MTIKTFWTILLKILGIYLLFSGLTVIPQSISSIFYVGENGFSNDYIWSILIIAIVALIYIFILIGFLFKPTWLITILRLEKGFLEDKIDLDISKSQVLSISVMVIGGLLFIDTLPLLCKNIFTFLQIKAVFNQNPQSGWVIFYFVKTLIGFILMTNSKFIVTILMKKQRQEKDIVE